MLLRLQILSTGQFLYLSDKALTVTIRSSLFQDVADLKGSISFPGTMPLEDNMAIINNAHLINSDASLRTFMVQVWLGYLPWKVARLNFTITDGAINYMLYIDGSIIAKRLQTLKLNQLYIGSNDGQINFPSPAAYQAWLTASVTAAPGTYPLVLFPYKNEGAYKTIDPANYGDYPNIAFPVNKYINAWQITGGGAGSFKWNTNFNASSETQAPFIYLTYLLRRFCEFFDLTPLGTWLDSESANRIVIHSNVVMPLSDRIPDITWFLPDTGVNDFLIECRTRFGLLIDPDILSKTCVIESLANLENTEDEIDLTGAQVLSYDELETTLKAYTIKQSAADADKAYSDTEKATPDTLQIGDPDTATEVNEIPLTSVATKMAVEISPNANANWRVPYINQSVAGTPPFTDIAEVLYVDQSKFALRFLYYYGLQQNDAGFLYPYGSSDNLDVFSQPIGTYSLSLTSAGVTNLAVKRYYEFMKNAKPFQMGFELTAGQFLAIRANTRVKIKDPNNQATVYCLLDEISADLDNEEMVLAKATLYPILRPVNLTEEITVVPPVTVPPIDPPNNGTVYVKLSLRNFTTETTSMPRPGYTTDYVDVYLSFFANAAATIPKNVTDLQVRIKTIATATGSQPVSNIYKLLVTSSANEYLAYVHTSVHSTSGQSETRTVYSVEPSAAYTVIT